MPSSTTDPIEHAEAWVPFKETAIASLKVWLTKRGPFAPGDLAKSSRVQALQAVAWSAWVVKGSREATYAADVSGGGRKAAWGPTTADSIVT